MNKNEVMNKTHSRPTDSALPKMALNLERMLPYRLRLLTKRLGLNAMRFYSGRWGLSIPEWHIVALLGAHAPLSATELAELSPMGKPQVSRTLKRMESRGLVTFQADTADGRRSFVWLTAEGARIHDGIAPRALLREDKLLEVLDPKEQRQLDEIINKLNKRLDELDRYGLDQPLGHSVAKTEQLKSPVESGE